MRAILIRHYKTLINASDEIMGWGDAPRAKDWEPDLTYVSKILDNQDIQYTSVYTSDLERSRQTGRYFAKMRGISILHDHAELNEVNYGSLYRKSKKWVKNNIPQYKTEADYVFENGESFRQMQKRSVDFFLSLPEKHKDETILIVAHAGVIRGLICYFLDLDYTSNLKQKITHRYVGEYRFMDKNCTRYSELGEPSGFVENGLVKIPFTCPLLMDAS
ncbi:MAG TPA: histidine phosphatase family protein [Gammaproteobacteria bacterium]